MARIVVRFFDDETVEGVARDLDFDRMAIAFKHAETWIIRCDQKLASRQRNKAHYSVTPSVTG